jgi:ribonuclease HI
MAERLLLYCDGSVRSGGRAGVGYVLATPDGFPLKRRGEPLPFPATVNEAEYYALISALREALRLGADSVEIYCDSALIVGQVCQGWACNAPHLQELRREVLDLLAQFESWTLERVPSKYNPLAHAYANVASQQNRRRFYPRKAVHIEKRAHEQHHNTGGTNTVKITFTDYTPLPTGSYRVCVTDVQEKDGMFGKQIQFTLEVTEGTHAGRTLKAWCNPSQSTNSKLYKWSRALLNTEKLTALDLTDLVGREGLAQVVQQRSENGNTYSRVVEILPYDPFLEEDVA